MDSSSKFSNIQNNFAEPDISLMLNEDISDLTSQTNQVNNITNQINLPSYNNNLFLELKNGNGISEEIKFDNIFLSFRSKKYEIKYQCFLLKYLSPDFFIYAVALPHSIYTSIFTLRLRTDIISNIYVGYAYAMLIFGILTVILNLQYARWLKRWSDSYKSVHLGGQISFETEGGTSINSVYVQQALKLSKYGIFVVTISVLYLCMYVVYRVSTGVCYADCFNNFPLLTTFFAALLPLHITIVMFIKWKTTLILQAMSFIFTSIAYFIRYKPVLSNIIGYLIIIGIWVLTFLSQYVIQYSRINDFKNREILMNLICDNQRESLLEIANLCL